MKISLKELKSRAFIVQEMLESISRENPAKLEKYMNHSRKLWNEVEEEEDKNKRRKIFKKIIKVCMAGLIIFSIGSYIMNNEEITILEKLKEKVKMTEEWFEEALDKAYRRYKREKEKDIE